MLDVDGTTGLAQSKGILIPRVTNAQRLAMNPLPAAAQGLLVYQTNVAGASLEGFYYNTSITVVPNWVYLDGRAGWEITGNNNVTAANNFIGTLVNEDFVVKTNGAAATNERMRVLRTGEVIVNNTIVGANVGDVFSVYSNGTNNGSSTNTSAIGAFAINGYSSAAGIGVYGENTGTGIGAWGNAINRGVEGDANLSTGLGVFGNNAAVAGAAVGVQGQSASPNSQAVVGIGNTSAGAIPAGTFGYGVVGQINGTISSTGVGVGVRGIIAATMTIGDARGVYGSSPSQLGTGVMGIATSVSAVAGDQPVGVYGRASSARGFGVQAVNSDVNGTGIITVGNNVAGQYLVTGSGAAINGLNIGTLSRSTGAASTGILSVSNGAPLTTIVGGSGVSGSSTRFGVVGWAQGGAAGTARTGGYFDCNAGASYAYVGMLDAANTAWKINGNGLVGTIVKDVNNNPVSMVCPEAPEVFFQDYGQSQLVNGTAHITLDPVFTKNIVVSPSHPLRVFVQLRGDCKGVYVTNETANGFDVIELQSGSSNTPFNWTITANRADETLSNGSLSNYSGLRFSPAPGPAQSTAVQPQTVSTTNRTVIEDAPVNLQKETKPKSSGKNPPGK
jgi:hypothetical protein